MDDRAPLATLELGSGFEPEDALAPAVSLRVAVGLPDRWDAIRLPAGITAPR